MYIMVRDYDNGEDGYDSYSCCDELITEKDRVKIFFSWVNLGDSNMVI